MDNETRVRQALIDFLMTDLDRAEAGSTPQEAIQIFIAISKVLNPLIGRRSVEALLERAVGESIGPGCELVISSSVLVAPYTDVLKLLENKGAELTRECTRNILSTFIRLLENLITLALTDKFLRSVITGR